ncbi:hypothetical protein [Rhodanobacter terrae]|uniref:Lipoprotein n=1 Tax=Rhodanobacter terrae TaxID=418647 RepID=A0ABW0T068_9GAMM
MHRLLALLCLILSLAGCDYAGNTIVRRSTVNGVHVMYSKVTVFGPSADFDCVQSRSGQCRYAVFKRDCSQQRSCASTPFMQFALAVDTRLHLTHLPHGFQFCVSADTADMTRECLHTEAATKPSTASVSD